MTAQIILNPGREKSLLRKHPWVFSRAIKTVQGNPESGETVEIIDSKGQFIALAAFSPSSQIRARVWSFDKTSIDQRFFEQKIATADNIKTSLIADQSNAYRVIAAESDGLPGIIVDKYNTLLVVQILSAGAELHKQALFDALLTVFPEHGIYERSDVDVRKKEGLQQHSGWVTAEQSPVVEIQEHGLRIQVNISKGHKTGFYLDQRDNREVVKRYSADKSVLNCFSYTGAFGINAAAAGANHVRHLDMSARALEQAQKNHKLNDLDNDKIEYVRGDVFKVLREYREQGKKFDTIIMDPPKFVENKNQMNAGCRGYKDVNMLAFQLLNSGGTLLTFSCSGLMEESLFQKIVADAALDAGVNGRIVEKLHQAKDHTIGLSYPEALYLKGLVVQID